MNRVKIDVPQQLPFVVNMPLRITDINYGNHVGNQAFLELMHEARVRFLMSIGYGELSFAGASLIMADAAIEFKNEILYGDEVEVQLGIGACNRASFDIFYLIKTIRQGKQLIAAKGKTAMVCYNYAQKKTVSLPADALVKMQPFSIPAYSL